MINPNTVILGLFAATGLVAMSWGWAIITKGRKTLRWPSVEGVVERSHPSSDIDDLLPHIQFSYTVAGQTHRGVMEFPKGVTPTQEFTSAYGQKYPAGIKVPVYYDPAMPDQATLEPGLARGDWMVFALGAGMTAFGVLFLLFGG